MRRFATFILLLGPMAIVACLPLRPVLIAVWPFPVEEIVETDGDWTLVPVIGSESEPGKRIVRARTRPLSLVEVETADGRRLHGYLIKQEGLSSTEGTLTIETGPDQVSVVPSADLAGLLYPNDMSMMDRARLALRRILNRHPTR